MKKKKYLHVLAFFISLYAFSSSHAMNMEVQDESSAGYYKNYSKINEKEMKPRILIVGGGIGGLSLAKALQNHEIPFELAEKRKVWKHEGTGIALPANATWALHQLGFESEVNEKTKHIKAMSFTTDQDELLICEDITEVHNSGAQFRSIHRADLHGILLNRLNKDQIRMGSTIKTMVQKDDSGAIEVEFSDQSRRIYDLVVGADGIHSEVRNKVFGEGPLVYQGIVTWRTIVKTPAGLDHPIYMLGADSVFLLYPINTDSTYIYCHHIDPSHPDDVLENRIPKLQNLFGHYKGYVPQILSQIKDANQVIPGWLESVSEIKWSKGNVVLIGDASHACSPALQQGGAQAIEDGWVLGEEINSGMSRGESITQILTNFVNRRHERVKLIAEESDKKMKILPEVRNNFIKKNGAPNVAMFRIIMKENP